MNEPTKQSTVTTIKNAAIKHKTKILIATNVITLTSTVVLAKYVSVHNEFLKERGLLEEFAKLPATIEA